VLYGHDLPYENFSAFRILISTRTDKFSSIFFPKSANFI